MQKIQYLLRMFYRADSSSNSVFDFAAFEQMNGKTNSSMWLEKLEYIVLAFIESPQPKSASSSNFFDTMFDNSIDLHFTSFTVDINFEMGFFEDGGRLFPKEMTLDFEFVYDSGDLIKTYVAT